MAFSSSNARSDPRNGQEVFPDCIEIYIPKEAKVKLVPVGALPSGIMKTMGLPSVCADLGSQTATWISPVIIWEKTLLLPSGQPENSMARLRFPGIYAALASTEQGRQHWLSVTCCHEAAFNALREFMPLEYQLDPKNEGREACQASSIPEGPSLHYHQDSMVIHKGRAFLVIKTSPPFRYVDSSGQSLKVLSPETAQAAEPSASPETAQAAEPSASPEIAPPSFPVVKRPEDLRAQLQRFGITRQVRVTLTKLVGGLRSCQTTRRSCLMDPVPVGHPCCLEDAEYRMLLLGESCRSRCSRESPGNSFPLNEEPLDRSVPVEQEEGEAADVTEYSIASVEEEEQKEAPDVPEAWGAPVKLEQQQEEESVSKKPRLAPAPQLKTDGNDGWEGDNVWGRGWKNRDQVICQGTDSEAAGDAWFQEPERSVLLHVSNSKAVGFDFELSARRERINRIRKKLREKEAALEGLLSVVCAPLQRE